MCVWIPARQSNNLINALLLFRAHERGVGHLHFKVFMKWFRFYTEALNDVKVQDLPPELFKAWINLLCVASEEEERGALPSLRKIAFALRMPEECAENSEECAQNIITRLIEFGFIDKKNGGKLAIHGWEKWQYESDNVSKRVSKHRTKQQCNVSKTLQVTPPEQIQNRTDTETEAETDKETPSPEKQTPNPQPEFLNPPGIESDVAMAIRKVCNKGLVLSPNDTQKLRTVLDGLKHENVTVAQVEEFGRKVSGHWCGRDKNTKQPRAPGIMQVLENWREVLAMPEPVEAKPPMTMKDMDAIAAKYK